ncbi:uncharacterized protein LOC143227910 [Tachypleus tridentatus]|uniref:uncharacterized protein LOC143227910 n=1 Tax=Tachypleus tridentatus TaxID=6853 RepID=UPI003FD46397
MNEAKNSSVLFVGYYIKLGYVLSLFKQVCFTLIVRVSARRTCTVGFPSERSEVSPTFLSPCLSSFGRGLTFKFRLGEEGETQWPCLTAPLPQSTWSSIRRGYSFCDRKRRLIKEETDSASKPDHVYPGFLVLCNRLIIEETVLLNRIMFTQDFWFGPAWPGA